MAVLETKLHLPVPRRVLVPRPRLTALLPTGTSAMPRLVLVSAPAGFGKTTVLSQWLATRAEFASHVAWLSLDHADNDPARFLALWLPLCADIRRRCGKYGGAGRVSMRGGQQTAGFIEAFTGSHRYVLGYLVEEVLGRLRSTREMQFSTREQHCSG